MTLCKKFNQPLVKQRMTNHGSVASQHEGRAVHFTLYYLIKSIDRIQFSNISLYFSFYFIFAVPLEKRYFTTEIFNRRKTLLLRIYSPILLRQKLISTRITLLIFHSYEFKSFKLIYVYIGTNLCFLVLIAGKKTYKTYIHTYIGETWIVKDRSKKRKKVLRQSSGGRRTLVVAPLVLLPLALHIHT